MRRWWVVGVLVVVVGVAVGGWLLGRGGDDGSTRSLGDRRAGALAFAPTSAEVVAEFDVQAGSQQGERLRDLARTFAAARFAADGVRSSVRRLGLDAGAELPALLGGPVVAWGPAAAVTGLAASIDGLALDLPAVARAGVSAAVVGRSADAVGEAFDHAVDDGRLTKTAAPTAGVEGYAPPGRAIILGRRGAEVVLGADEEAVRRAFAGKDAGGGLTPVTFADRLGPLARAPALIRAAGPARPIVASRAAGVPWAQALREGSLAITLQDPGVRLRVHLATDPSRVTDAQLPLAPGAQPPQPAPGTRQIDAAVRDPARAIRFFDDNKDALDLPFLDPLKNALGSLDSVKGPLKTFGRIDVDDILDGLTGTATITPEGGDALALRVELTTGGRLKTALDRLVAVPDVALDLAGVSLNVSRDGDAYIITNDGHPVAKLAVLGAGDTTLVASNSQAVSLRAVAARRPVAATTTGAVTFHLGGRALQDELVRRLGLPDLSRLVLNGFGDVDGGVRAERGGVDLDATLTLD